MKVNLDPTISVFDYLKQNDDVCSPLQSFLETSEASSFGGIRIGEGPAATKMIKMGVVDTYIQNIQNADRPTRDLIFNMIKVMFNDSKNIYSYTGYQVLVDTLKEFIEDYKEVGGKVPFDISKFKTYLTEQSGQLGAGADFYQTFFSGTRIENRGSMMRTTTGSTLGRGDGGNASDDGRREQYEESKEGEGGESSLGNVPVNMDLNTPATSSASAVTTQSTAPIVSLPDNGLFSKREIYNVVSEQIRKVKQLSPRNLATGSILDYKCLLSFKHVQYPKNDGGICNIDGSFVYNFYDKFLHIPLIENFTQKSSQYPATVSVEKFLYLVAKNLCESDFLVQLPQGVTEAHTGLRTYLNKSSEAWFNSQKEYSPPIEAEILGLKKGKELPCFQESYRSEIAIKGLRIKSIVNKPDLFFTTAHLLEMDPLELNGVKTSLELRFSNNYFDQHFGSVLRLGQKVATKLINSPPDGETVIKLAYYPELEPGSNSAAGLNKLLAYIREDLTTTKGASYIESLMGPEAPYHAAYCYGIKILETGYAEIAGINEIKAKLFPKEKLEKVSLLEKFGCKNPTENPAFYNKLHNDGTGMLLIEGAEIASADNFTMFNMCNQIDSVIDGAFTGWYD